MLDIDNLRSEIENLCKCLRVKKLDIFGSATTEAFSHGSDVDLLVQFDRRGDGLFNRYFDLKEGLERILNRNVDLITEESIKNPYFKQEVERTRKNVYAT
jgi:predicted nucleotidyltransferase